jgi:hypothetical protein
MLAAIVSRWPFCVIMASSLTENRLCTKLKEVAIEASSLMYLPVEVRLIVYKHLFSNSENIKLNINDAGYIQFTNSAKLNLSSLRTCKMFYIEACPVLYGINTFVITFKNVHRLAKMLQGSRLCIENLTVEATLPAQSGPLTPPATFTSGERSLASVEILDLATIGTVLCGLHNLLVKPPTASAFLAIVLQLSNSLPCSPIRAWPILEVIVDIKRIPDGDRGANSSLLLTDKYQKLISIDRRLSALTETSILGLGHEMPDYKTIRVKGCLPWRLCQLIEDHKSSFGDCSFAKEVVRESMANDREGSQYKYTWRRVDEDEQQAKARNATVNMHQWVPRLSSEDYGKLLASFGAGPETAQYSRSQDSKQIAGGD